MTDRPWQTGVSHTERWVGYYLPGFDPTDPSSQVMRNNLGITDQARLDDAESRYVTANMAFYLSSPHPGDDFGLARLQSIHHALFSDVYPWAGEIRTVGMSKTGSKPFLAPTDITQTMAHLEDTLTVPRQVVGRISSCSKVGTVGLARPRWTSRGRFQAIASWGRTSLYSVR